MLRVLLAFLLVANLLFLGWAQGWFAPAWPGPREAEREPGRLAAQVAPERITVLAPQAASAAIAAVLAGTACLESGPFGEAELGLAEAALAEAGLPSGSWAREPGPAAESAASDPASTPAKGASSPAAASPRWLRVARADADLQRLLRALPETSFPAGFSPCATRP